MDELITDTNTQISAVINKDTSFKEKNYFMKKTEAEELYDGFFIDNNNDKIIIERIMEVPSLKNIHFEPATKNLYHEVISNYWIGNFNASIVLLSVFLEAYLKEQYYFKTKKHSDATLKPLIDICFKEQIIDHDQRDFLSKFAENVRNNYIHAKTQNIIKDITIPMAIINFDAPSNPESTYGNSDLYPFLKDIAKFEKDKMDSRTLIIDISKIVIDLSKSYEELSEENEK